jgi:hypothetical protein
LINGVPIMEPRQVDYCFRCCCAFSIGKSIQFLISALLLRSLFVSFSQT